MAGEFEVKIGPDEIYKEIVGLGKALTAYMHQSDVTIAKLDGRVTVLEKDRDEQVNSRTKITDRVWLLWTTIILAVVSLAVGVYSAAHPH